MEGGCNYCWMPPPPFASSPVPHSAPGDFVYSGTITFVLYQDFFAWRSMYYVHGVFTECCHIFQFHTYKKSFSKNKATDFGFLDVAQKTRRGRAPLPILVKNPKVLTNSPSRRKRGEGKGKRIWGLSGGRVSQLLGSVRFQSESDQSGFETGR